MELLPQSFLLFTKEEVRVLLEQKKCGLNSDEVYDATGGWPGCVDLMKRLALHQIYDSTVYTVNDFLHCYEMETYIRREILDSLSSGEHELMQIGAICPWLNEELCRDVWKIEGSLEPLQSLERKGLFIKNHRKKHWQLAPLFRAYYQNPNNIEKSLSQSWKYLGEWYEKHGYLKEAALCFGASEDKMRLFQYMIEHYEVVPFIGIAYDEVMDWAENRPELIYLRGMHHYSKQNFVGLRAEIHQLESMFEKAKGLFEVQHLSENVDGQIKNIEGLPENPEEQFEKIKEFLLNLYYVLPERSMDTWLQFLEENEPANGKFHLYGMLGNSFSFLCGLRDLTDLFACTKKEEKRKEKIWNEKLDADSRLGYQLAKIEYYIETGREDLLEEEEREILFKVVQSEGMDVSPKLDEFYMACIHLLCKWKPSKENGTLEEIVRKGKDYLVRQENEIYAQNAEAMYVLYVQENSRQENLSRWLRNFGNEISRVQISEKNYVSLLLGIKGYIFLNQYDKAEKIISLVIPYLQSYRRSFFLSEALFLQALIYWGKGQRNKALKSVIESFVVNGSFRYVGFYTRYGKKGQEVLEHYVEWMEKNAPGGWHRKKKYNYGSVLRMPVEDYLEVVLRMAKKETKFYCGLEELEEEERLTMMESIILQQLSRGLTNAEICSELNLKLPTVKTHIYSLYKKMGVNTRVQAIVKGKELGLVK